VKIDALNPARIETPSQHTSSVHEDSPRRIPHVRGDASDSASTRASRRVLRASDRGLEYELS
jgi:hypothetical protein